MDKIYVPWPIAMEIADILDKKGLSTLAREARKAVWDEAQRLYMKQQSTIKPLYIYLGPGVGYGAIMDHKPKSNQFHWYELGPAVSDDPKDADDLPIDDIARKSWSLSHNPRQQRVN